MIWHCQNYLTPDLATCVVGQCMTQLLRQYTMTERVNGLRNGNVYFITRGNCGDSITKINIIKYQTDYCMQSLYHESMF
jgi:hypothetical protein